tara:strand:- start:24173 stop:26905 length:2733 start_codon:yes stop_codon:yes gene_type:complete
MENTQIQKEKIIMKHTITLLALFLCVATSFAQTVNIDGDPYGGNPYATIATAITAANTDDVILITGIHTESISVSKSITLRGTDPTTDIIQAAASEVKDGTGSRVVNLSGTATITIENLGIRYGNNAANGAGINVDKVSGQVTLQNLIIENNYTTSNGGGLSFAGTNVNVIKSTIKNNTSVLDGGGIITAPNNGYAADNTINIQQSLIDTNDGRNGGGLYINGNNGFGDEYRITVNVENTTILNNTTTSASGGSGGGGIWSKAANYIGADGNGGSNVTLQIVHATIYNNTHASTTKNGIQFTKAGTESTNFSAYNSIVINDTTGEKALNFANTNTVEVINCILGGLNSANTTFLDNADRNNERGQTAAFAGLSSTLSDEGGATQVLTITEGGGSDNYCTASTGIANPSEDQRGYARGINPDAGAFEYYDNVWNGSADNSWANASNWSGGIPGSGDDVTIPSGITNYPTASGAVTVNSVTMSAGSSLIANSTFAGNVTYNRTLSTTNWYLVSSPVAGEIMTDMRANNSFATGTDSNIGFSPYTTSSDAWSYFIDTSTDPLVDGKGYSAKLSNAGDISFVGTINTDNVNSVSIDITGNGFNLLGNPYTSFINSETFLDANTNLDAQLWVWNQASGMYEVQIKANAFSLAPSQGFFVKANSGTTVNFAESNQSHNASDTFLRNSNNRPEVHLLMTDGTSERFAKIYYIDGITTGFDNGYEGETFGGIPNSLDVFTELVSNNVGKKYQIQSLPNSDLENMVVPVGLIADAGDISFSVNDINLPAGYKVFLEDKDTGDFIRLDEEGSKYDVTLNAAVNGIGRFYLHTATSVLSAGSFDTTNISAYLSNKNNLKIIGIQQGTTQVRLFNILGKQVLNTSLQSNGLDNVTLPNLRTGVYILQINSEEGTINKKLFIE